MDWVVTEHESGLELLEFLQGRVPSASCGYLRQLIKKGRVTLDGATLDGHAKVRTDDTIHLPDSGRLLELLTLAVDRSGVPEILYESREVLVVAKPPGLAVHAGVGHVDDNLTRRVESLIASRGDRYSVAPVHRLDLETSGPVLFGKGKQACGRLGSLFMRHEVEKSYLVLVAGEAPGSGVLHSTLAAKGKQKEAVSSFRAVTRNERASLLEVRLFTGRQHQIRRQLAALGYPVFGDRRYGGPCPDSVPRLFLHCSCLAFVDPFSGAPLTITSQLPDDLEAVLVHFEMSH